MSGCSLLRPRESVCTSKRMRLQRYMHPLVTSMALYATLLCMLATTTVVHAKPQGHSTFELAENASLEMTQRLANIKNMLFPWHCSDIQRAGQTASGVYTVFHEAAGPSGQQVYCDMDTDGGGWTVIQRRGQFGNHVLYFQKNWEQYASGFGEPSKEYWIGNRALHALTSGDEAMALRVVLSNTTQDSASIDYASVRVDSEAKKFTIHVGEFLGPEGWDSFSYCDGMMFSTFGQDNDGQPDGDCAVIYRGGWWYRACYTALLNGPNLNGYYKDSLNGITWGNRGGATGLYYYSYPNVLMMIRPEGHLIR